MRKLIIAVTAALALCLSGTAGAANKKLWHLPELDAAVSEVAGTNLTVVTSDSYAEWDVLAGMVGVDGWTCILCSPYALIYNPFDGKVYNVYHTVWIHYDLWLSLAKAMNRRFLDPLDYSRLGEAMLTIDHEAMHWRLFSRDESRVNACALQDLPRFLTNVWHIPATYEQTVTVAQHYRVRVRYRARVHGKLVWRHRLVTRTRWVDTLQTVANPVYAGILNSATAFRATQPAPYNSGPCF